MARAHLVRESIAIQRIVVTGNTGIDALLSVMARNEREHFRPRHINPALLERSPLVVVTAHRRETFGEGVTAICDALLALAKCRTDLTIVFSVHPNPQVHGPVHARLANQPNICLTPPLEYREFVYVMAHADVILTDSGGIQEEVASLGKPVLVMRDVTERPEAIAAGVAELVGTCADTIVARTLHALDHPSVTGPVDNPFGDGRASERIVLALLDRFGS